MKRLFVIVLFIITISLPAYSFPAGGATTCEGTTSERPLHTYKDTSKDSKHVYESEYVPPPPAPLPTPRPTPVSFIHRHEVDVQTNVLGDFGNLIGNILRGAGEAAGTLISMSNVQFVQTGNVCYNQYRCGRIPPQQFMQFRSRYVVECRRRNVPPPQWCIQRPICVNQPPPCYGPRPQYGYGGGGFVPNVGYPGSVTYSNNYLGASLGGYNGVWGASHGMVRRGW